MVKTAQHPSILDASSRVTIPSQSVIIANFHGGPELPCMQRAMSSIRAKLYVTP